MKYITLMTKYNKIVMGDRVVGHDSNQVRGWFRKYKDLALPHVYNMYILDDNEFEDYLDIAERKDLGIFYAKFEFKNNLDMLKKALNVLEYSAKRKVLELW